jgi:hypothetical protein
LVGSDNTNIPLFSIGSISIVENGRLVARPDRK